MNRREYLALKAKIEQKCREDLAALERVWQLSGGTEESAESDNPEQPIRDRLERGAVDQQVRWAAAHATGNFDLRWIQRFLNQQSPTAAAGIRRASISSALVRLADDDMLEVVEKGVGRRPTVYKLRQEKTPPESPF